MKDKITYPNFWTVYTQLGLSILDQKPTYQEHWQSVKSPDNTLEIEDASFCIPIPTPDILAAYTEPNLPWADIHFLERVGGVPLNPGKSYKEWPAYKNEANDKFRVEGENQFSHTYMERIWPKQAGRYTDRFLTHIPSGPRHSEQGTSEFPNRQGIRYEYGDLDSVIALLKRDPSTRQAYLPIWFPEDTGNEMNQRVPCTLGYLFLIRDGKLNIKYYIRSCDFLRHFQDDVYLAMKLVYHILLKLDGEYQQGALTMHVGSLHIFEADKNALIYKLKKKLN